MAKKSDSKVVKIACTNCGGDGLRNHSVLADTTVSETNDEAGFWLSTDYQICQCRGCDEVRFRSERVFSEDYDEEGNYLKTVKVYPDQMKRGRPVSQELQDLSLVGYIYSETLIAYNNGAMILAGGGLRAIVEAICRDQSVPGDTLQKKIDALVQKGLLAKPQADLLHEERYIGNTALHDVSPPPARDIELGLDIVEGLLSTIYLLPKKADAMRAARLKRKSKAKST